MIFLFQIRTDQPEAPLSTDQLFIIEFSHKLERLSNYRLEMCYCLRHNSIRNENINDFIGIVIIFVKIRL